MREGGRYRVADGRVVVVARWGERDSAMG
jgi:hypothetical protein